MLVLIVIAIWEGSVYWLENQCILYIIKNNKCFWSSENFSMLYWPVHGDLPLNTILECSIPKSQPVEDSVFKNIRRMAIDCWLADDTIIHDIAFRSTFLKMVKLSRESTQLVTDSTGKHCWQNVAFCKFSKVYPAKMLPLLTFRQTKICKTSGPVTNKNILFIVVHYQSLGGRGLFAS